MTSRACATCLTVIPEGRRVGTTYCTNACRQAAYRARHPRPRAVRTPRSCSVVDCAAVHYGRGLCRAHWNNLRRYGEATTSYAVARRRLLERRGAPLERRCATCWRPARTWVLRRLSTALRLLTPSGRQFSPDPGDYTPRCHEHTRRGEAVTIR